jgi:hypothetical protein
MKSLFAFRIPKTVLVAAVLFLCVLNSEHAVALTVSTDGSVITPSSGGTLSTVDGTRSFGTGPDQYGDWQLLLNGTQVGIGLYMEVTNGGQLDMADEPGPSDWWLWSGGQNGSWSSSSNPGGGGGGNSGGGGVGGGVPYGVPAPDGYQWVLTFDDEFTQDSGVNGNLWNAGASNTDWCASTLFWFNYPDGTAQLGNYGGNYMFNEPEDDPCQSYPGTVSFDSSLGFGMTIGPQYLDSNGVPQGSPDAAIQTGGPTANAAKFIQMYGYWKASVRKSTTVGGPHFDFWMHPIPECNDGTPGCWTPEIDVGEQPTWDPSADDSNTQLSFSLLDYSPGGCGSTVDVGVDLTADFHTYAVWWNNDGSGPYGSMTFYFDGNQVLGPCAVSSQATNITSGLYTILSLDGGSNGNLGNPDWVRWVRAWQLAPN